MADYIGAFESGITQHFKFVSWQKRQREACQLVAVFSAPYSSPIERQVAITVVGLYAGAINDSSIANVVKGIFKRCALLCNGEEIQLFDIEEALIKAAIEGTLFKPF